MLFYNFNGYTGFQERFGIQEHGNGEKSRKNKILLSFIKNKDLLHQAVVNDDYSFLSISSMSELKQTVLSMVTQSGRIDDLLPHRLSLMHYTFYSAKYETDDYQGLCEDFDSRSIRYLIVEYNKIYKMKAGKMLRALILETAFGQMLPEQVLTYVLEEFTADWITYANRSLPEHELVVNDEFDCIYDSSELEGDFGSCMVDKGYHSFYKDAVKAKAAFLLNNDGNIMARCIIFTEVHEEGSEKIWRLAERQYASGGSDALKRALVDALIQAGEIDGYKKVGAGCGDAREFVDLDGNSLSEKCLWIECSLGLDDPLSYQDSFKYYDYSNEKAYNRSCVCYDYELDTTEGSLNGNEDQAYDDWHGYYCEDATPVYVNGREYYCDVENLDDFVLIGDEYYHIDDCVRCDGCGEWVLRSDSYYSELTDEDYCSETCMEHAEEEYKKDNWIYSEFDEDYYENEEDVVSFWQWNRQTQDYKEVTIYVGTLIHLLRNNKLHLYENEVYDKLRHGKPIGLAA